MKGSRKLKREAFTLVEILCVLVIVAIAATTLALTAQDSDARERRLIRNEARDFCAWIKYRMAKAAREGEDFKFLLTDGAEGYAMRAIWLAGGRLKNEAYSFSNAALAYEGARELYFSSRWFTLTPAATFIVISRRNRDIRFFVTVSAAGYARVKDKP